MQRRVTSDVSLLVDRPLPTALPSFSFPLDHNVNQLLLIPWSHIAAVSATWPVGAGDSRPSGRCNLPGDCVMETVWTGIFLLSLPLAVDTLNSREWETSLVKNDVIRRKAFPLQDFTVITFHQCLEWWSHDYWLNLFRPNKLLCVCITSDELCCHSQLRALYWWLHLLYTFPFYFEIHVMCYHSAQFLLANEG